MPRSRRSICAAASPASRSSISTRTTATARRRSSTSGVTCWWPRRTRIPPATTPSIRASPKRRAAAQGPRANLNLPLPQGADDAAYVAACQRLAEAALAFGAEALVLSAGWDAHRDDPTSRLQVTSEAYGPIGALFGRLRLPTVILQEGGYSLSATGEAARPSRRPSLQRADHGEGGLAAVHIFDRPAFRSLPSSTNHPRSRA